MKYRQWFRGRKRAAGMTLIEASAGVAIMGICASIAVPILNGAMSSYRLSAAVRAVSGAIQSTRYQAIRQGYHYKITFDSASRTYQISSKVPPATTFSNSGTAILWSSTTGISLSPSTTFDFSPGGIVTATVGSSTFSVANDRTTETITVSGVGNVSVTP